jgi:hypothetical protein
MVAFDAVGPSASGAGNSSSATLSWTHTSAGAQQAILAGVALGVVGDGGFSLSATCDGATMAAAGPAVHANGGTDGFIQWFYILGTSAGSHTIVATAAGGTPLSLSGGSVSFTGAGGLGTQSSSVGSGTAVSTATGGSTSGNITAALATCGSDNFTSGGSGTSRWVQNGPSTSGAGSSAGQTQAGSGSALTFSWTITSDFWAVIAVEVQAPAAGGPPRAPLVVPQAAVMQAANW